MECAVVKARDYTLHSLRGHTRCLNLGFVHFLVDHGNCCPSKGADLPKKRMGKWQI